MHVAQILKEKGRAVETIGPEATLGDVVRLLAQRRIGAVVVATPSIPVAGIVSERDVVRLIGQQGAGALGLAVGDVMTRPVRTCHETDSIDTLMSVMTANRFRHLPVVEQGRLVGIVSIGDVVKNRVAEVESEASAMRDYIRAG